MRAFPPVIFQREPSSLPKRDLRNWLLPVLGEGKREREEGEGLVLVLCECYLFIYLFIYLFLFLFFFILYVCMNV